MIPSSVFTLTLRDLDSGKIYCFDVDSFFVRRTSAFFEARNLEVIDTLDCNDPNFESKIPF